MSVHGRFDWLVVIFLFMLLGFVSVPAYSQTPGLCEALDDCSLTWTTSGDSPWVVQKGVVYFGDSAVASGRVGNNQTSVLETSVNGPGVVTFYWKISSEAFNDFLIFSIDGVEQTGKISAEVDWQQKTFSIDPGKHRLQWIYRKDKSGSWGYDTAWLDKVEYEAIPVTDFPPSVSITSPAGDTTVSGTVSIQASASDDYGISKVELYIDGVVAATCPVASCSYSWDSINSSNDSHEIKALAYDTAGQTGQSQVTVRTSNLGSLSAEERNSLIALYNSTNGPSWNNKNNWLKKEGTECTWFGVSCNASGTHVKAINLYGNNLVGNLPAQLSSLAGLEVLNLSGNFLSGALRPELGNLRQLTVLDLSNNQLSGGLPSQLGNMTRLGLLSLSGNRLSGNLPPQLGNMTELVTLQLSQNQLSGAIPSALGNLRKMQQISLNDNLLTGSIPVELGNLQQLTQLSLQQNQLSGTIPPQLGDLASLITLQLQSNQLGGIIPYQLGNLVRLQVLELNGNQFISSIPSDLGRIRDLAVLNLQENQLGGSIPGALGNLSKLTTLHLSNNQLSENIPPELGKLALLSDLQLSNNNLTGAIPAELGDMTALSQLELYKNHLSGEIPEDLGKLVKLARLYLSDNQLSGIIPLNIGKLVGLKFLNLSSNQLGGLIPPEIGKLAELTTLELQSNQLVSEIPKEFSGLSSLRYLDLRWNALYSTDDTVLKFLANLQQKYTVLDWQGSQTIPPGDVKAVTISNSSIRVNWTPIPYSTGGGGYRVLYSTNHLGPYLLSGTTPNKTSSSFTLAGLPYSATPYFVVVQTSTNAHKNNQNSVFSDYSQEAVASTLIHDNPPAVTLVAPANGDKVSGLVVLEANALDDKGVSRVEFLVDGFKIAEDTAAPYTATWDASAYRNGSHSLVAKAYDALNQPAESGILVTVSNPAGSLYHWILPSSARVPGLFGGEWTTDLLVSNVGGAEASFTVKFLRNDSDGRNGPEAPFRLSAGKTLSLPDVLGNVFGLAEGYGAILLSSTTASLVMAGQTSTPAQDGTFGQSVPAFPMNALIDSSAPRSILGVRENEAFRTNLVLANASEVALQVDALLMGSKGEILATKSYSLLPLSMTQVNRVAHNMGLGGNVGGARLVLSTATSGGKFAAYASAIDNVTNDPRTLLPVSSPALILPSSARVNGFGGGLWTTDLTISNTGASSANVTLKFLGNNVDGRSGPEAFLTLAAGQTSTYPDILKSLFGLDSGFGAILLKSDATHLLMLGETSTPGYGGTVGQSVPAATAADEIGEGISKSILGVREDNAFRTNLVLASLTEATMQVDVQLVSADSTVLATRQYRLEPLEMTQVSRVVRDLGVSFDVTGARLVLSTSTAGGSLAAYGTLIDNVTSDPRTLLPQ